MNDVLSAYSRVLLARVAEAGFTTDRAEVVPIKPGRPPLIFVHGTKAGRE